MLPQYLWSVAPEKKCVLTVVCAQINATRGVVQSDLNLMLDMSDQLDANMVRHFVCKLAVVQGLVLEQGVGMARLILVNLEQLKDNQSTAAGVKFTVSRLDNVPRETVMCVKEGTEASSGPLLEAWDVEEGKHFA